MRRAREGLESLSMISLRRCCNNEPRGFSLGTIRAKRHMTGKKFLGRTVAAREVMSISMSFPSSSLRGFAVTSTALLANVEEKCR